MKSKAREALPLDAGKTVYTICAYSQKHDPMTEISSVMTISVSCHLHNYPFTKVQTGRDADPSPPSSAEVKNRVELYLYSP
jgi:hypothetical protein